MRVSVPTLSGMTSEIDVRSLATTGALDADRRFPFDRAVRGFHHQCDLASASHDDSHQFTDVDRIAARVIDPSRAEHRMLHGAEKASLGTFKRFIPVGKGELQHRAGATGEDVGFDANLTRGVIKTIRADLREVGAEVLGKRLDPWEKLSEHLEL